MKIIEILRQNHGKYCHRMGYVYKDNEEEVKIANAIAEVWVIPKEILELEVLGEERNQKMLDM